MERVEQSFARVERFDLRKQFSQLNRRLGIFLLPKQRGLFYLKMLSTPRFMGEAIYMF